MTPLGIMTLIAAGLFVLVIVLAVLMIASHVWRRREEKSVGWSVEEALSGLRSNPPASWEVDT